MTPYHIPALLQPTIDGLNIKKDGVYVDVTFGGGGHSCEILSRLGKDGKLFGFDQDEDAMKNVPDDKRFTFVRSNFCFLRNFLKYHNVEQVDGIIADLGVSFHHFDEEERGFSFRFDSDLDMRMNKQARLSASVVLNSYSEENLATVFYLYGEFHNSRRIAASIVKARNIQPIKKTGELMDILKPFFNKNKEKKDLARVFQALRIEVNNEMDTLKEMLTQAQDMLKPGGRLSVITYHSLEDRLVKNFIRTGNFEGKQEKDFYGNLLTPFVAVNHKVIVPSDEEIEQNPRSRSAKLRIAEKK